MKFTFLFVVNFLCFCWVWANSNEYDDYDVNLSNELKSDEKRNSNSGNLDESENDEEPFSNLLSELETDIGEQSILNKRNNDAGSGLAAQQKAAVTQSPTQANATVSGKPATQNITANGTSNASNKSEDNKKEKHSDIEKKQEKGSHKSKQNLKKRKKVDAVRQTSQEKYKKPLKTDQSTNAVHRQQKKKSNVKNIKEKKKVKNRYRSDKNKNADQVTCSKSKKYPTCMQIYRQCAREKSRCNQINSKKKINRSHPEKYSNKKTTVKDSKRLKEKSDGKKETYRHSPIKSAKDRKRPISRPHRGKKVSSTKPTVEKQKKLVSGEIRRMLKYLRRVKGTLSDKKQNSGKKGH